MIALMCFLGLWIGGCQPAHPASRQAVQPAPAPDRAPPATIPVASTWENKRKGIRLAYPSGWQPRTSQDYELMLVPIGATTDEPQITLDVPDLPPHMPWMIQMSRIEHDYLADLKKSHPDLKLQDATDAHVPGATARLVRCNWRQDKAEHDDVVLLMIHASAVYILDARTDAQHLPSTRAAFDSIDASIRWTN